MVLVFNTIYRDFIPFCLLTETEYVDGSVKIRFVTEDKSTRKSVLKQAFTPVYSNCFEFQFY